MTSPVESVLGSPDMTVPESTIRPGSTASPNTDRPADQIAGGIRSLTETLADQSGSERIGSISVVIPVYNEEGNLPELHRRLTAVLTDLGLPYEFVFVDDGSKDGTWNIMRAFHSDDVHVIAL